MNDKKPTNDIELVAEMFSVMSCFSDKMHSVRSQIDALEYLLNGKLDERSEKRLKMVVNNIRNLTEYIYGEGGEKHDDGTILFPSPIKALAHAAQFLINHGWTMGFSTYIGWVNTKHDFREQYGDYAKENE